MKKILVAMLTLVLALSMSSLVFAASSTEADWDIDTDEWAVRDIDGFALEKIGSGGDSGDNIFTKSITGAFDISYNVTFAHAQDIVDSHTISLRVPVNPEVKIFIRVQGCNGSAIIKGQLFDGDWNNLFGDDNWISDAGQEISVSMSRAEGSDSMTFTVKSGDTVLRTADITHDKVKAANFFDYTDDEVKGLELRLGGDGGDGRLTLSNFDINVTEPPKDESQPDGDESKPGGDESKPETPDTSGALPVAMMGLMAVSASAIAVIRSRKK